VPRLLFMFHRFTSRNDVRDIVPATRRPDDEQRQPLKDTYALESNLTVRLTQVFHREQLTVEETIQVFQVNAVIGRRRCDFGLITKAAQPRDSGASCRGR
jgi:hypothetical protein